MTGRHGKQIFTRRFTGRLAACMMASSFTLMAVPALSLMNDSVSVDLSVLNDGGAISPTGLPEYSRSDKLLLPPLRVPKSQLYLAPSNAPVLVRPTASRVNEPRTGAGPDKPLVSNVNRPLDPVPQAQTAPEVLAPGKTMMPVAVAPDKPTMGTTETAAPASSTMASSSAALPSAPPAPPAPPAPSAANAPSAPPQPPKMLAAPVPIEPTAAVASVNSSADIKPGRAARIEFGPSATKIPGDVREKLRILAESVRDTPDLRLQLMAYAGEEGLSASKARRMSLSRALSVRSFLIENGVRSTRIDVRALGNKTSEQPANRVDVNIAKR